MLVNLSNHPSGDWDARQIKTAESLYGTIVDLPFPYIEPEWDTQKVLALAREYYDKAIVVLGQCSDKPEQNAVQVQGEFTFTFALVSMFLRSGVRCVSSTSQRQVKEKENGEKIAKFTFVQFRNYSD